MNGMVKSFYGKIVLVLIIKTTNIAWGISTAEVSPALTQTTWATNYVGPLFTAKFSPTTTALDFDWVVTQQFAFIPISFLTLTSAECATSGTITVNGFTATCSGTETTLTAVQPITLPLIIGLTATVSGTTAINTVLNTQVTPTDCQEQQNLATFVSSTSTPCSYNCTSTFQCIAGYSTFNGPTYTARCNSFATLESAYSCFLQVTTATTSTSLPVWAIVLIALGGLAVLAMCIFLLWKFCSRTPQVNSGNAATTT